MKKLLLSVLLTLGFSSLQAAAPGTHVFFAQQWMAEHPIESIEDQKAFITGNLFPDIRYLGTISRSKTHEKDLSAEKIKKSSSFFKAGMRLHAYVDVQREKIVKKAGISYALKVVPKNLRVLFLKTLEDEIYWDKIDLQFAQDSLCFFCADEYAQDVSKQTIQKWHHIMTDYFKQRPSEFLKMRADNGESFLDADADTVKVWSRLIPQYASDPVFIEYAKTLNAGLCKKFSIKN
jgi:hypothetical protein